MTSEEIKRLDELALSATAWLKEIALQLAIANEKHVIPVEKQVPRPTRVK